jgi:superfamily I DNA/RNA helicase
LPHKRSLDVSEEKRECGEGIEAERRLGYVAFTRAQERLEIHYDIERPSAFLFEAGIIPAPAKPSRAPRKPPPVPGLSPAPGGSLRSMLKQLLGS